MNRALISFTFLLLGVLNGHAQKIPDYSLKHNLKQGGLSMEFTVLDSDKKQPTNHHSRKIYFWYKAQQVMQTQGGHAGIPLHGLFRSFYPNKQLCDQGEFRKGLKTGTWTYWTTGGTLNRKEHWKNGEQRGRQYYYDEKGNLRKIVSIYRYTGKQHPDSLEWIRGRRTRITVYDSLGRKTAVERYFDGVQDGKSTYYSDTSSYTVHYVKGAPKAAKPAKPVKAGKKTPATEATEKAPLLQRIQFWKKKSPEAADNDGNQQNEQRTEKAGRKKRAKKQADDEKADARKESRPKKKQKSKTPEQ